MRVLLVMSEHNVRVLALLERGCAPGRMLREPTLVTVLSCRKCKLRAAIEGICCGLCMIDGQLYSVCLPYLSRVSTV